MAARAYRLLASAAALLIAAAPAPKASKPLTQEEQALVAAATERGALLYAYDQAAWHGTDDMREKMGGKLSGIGGWVVEGSAQAPHLTMVDTDEKEPHALYKADFAAGKLVASHLVSQADDRRLAPAARTMVAALSAARQALSRDKIGACKPEPFNTVVVAGAGSLPTLVYFLTPQTSNDAVPLAGHYLVEVASDGTAGPVRKFTNVECMEMPLRDPTGPSSGMGMTDLLHKTPTEIQVFTSLTAHVPVYVATVVSDRLWVVEEGRVRVVADSLK
jgi:hypothetical protein